MDGDTASNRTPGRIPTIESFLLHGFFRRKTTQARIDPTPKEPYYVLQLNGVQMLPMKKISFTLLSFSLFLFTACATATPVVVTPTPQPTPTEVRVLPTPSSPGNSITSKGLQVTMTQAEITDSFVTEFGSQRVPSPGLKFLWVHVQLKNTEPDQVDVPLPEHFSVLYAATELKPTYGHRKEYTDYTTLEQFIFSNQTIDAWLRFDIPVNAELKDLRFVFLPESSGVGVSFSSPNYPYAKDHPTFVWNCAP
jgi:hypothetical protein